MHVLKAGRCCNKPKPNHILESWLHFEAVKCVLHIVFISNVLARVCVCVCTLYYVLRSNVFSWYALYVGGIQFGAIIGSQNLSTLLPKGRLILWHIFCYWKELLQVCNGTCNLFPELLLAKLARKIDFLNVLEHFLLQLHFAISKWPFRDFEKK